MTLPLHPSLAFTITFLTAPMAPPSSSRRLPWSSDGGGELSRPRNRWQLVAMQFKGRRRRTDLDGLLFGFRQIGGQEFMGMLLPVLGSMVQRVVSEEMEKAFRRFTAPAPPRLLPVGWNNQRPRYQLVFKTGLKTVYTMSKLEPDEGPSIKVALVQTLPGNNNDQQTIEPVRSGHLSSAKVEVVVLHGHFNARDDESWTPEDFDRHIVSGREKSAQLLTGNLTLRLSGGEAVLENASFTDNSSFTSTKMFRLGLRLLPNPPSGDGERVLEGVTKPFRVKERRVEGFEKHYPPLLDDEVWRLEKIRKNGPYHEALTKEGIDSVQKFLRACMMDEQKVLNVIKGCSKIFSKMSQSTWKSIIGHAMTCKFGDGLYLHEARDQGAGLFFDEIYRLVGVKFGDCYKPIDQLDQVEKNLVDSLKREAYRSMGDLQFNYKTVNNQPVPQKLTAQDTSMFPAFPDQQISNFAQLNAYLGDPSDALGCVSMHSTSNVGLDITSFVQGQTSHEVQFRHEPTADRVVPCNPRITRLKIPQTQTTYLDPDGSSAAVPCQASAQFDLFRQDQASNFSYSCQPHNSLSSANDFMSLTQPHFPLPVQNESFSNHSVELCNNGLSVIQSQQAAKGFQPSRTNSFDVSCDEVLQSFMSQISNGEGASTPLSPRKWVKIRAVLKLASVGRFSRRYSSGPYYAPPMPSRLVPTI